MKIKEKVLKEIDECDICRTQHPDGICSFHKAKIDGMNETLAEVGKVIDEEYNDWENEDLIRTFTHNIKQKLGIK